MRSSPHTSTHGHAERIGSNATRPAICYRTHYLRRQDIDILDMDDIRKTFSKLKKGFKHQPGGKKRTLDREGTGSARERASPSASLSQPDSRIAASSHNEEGTRVSTDVSQPRSRGLSLSSRYILHPFFVIFGPLSSSFLLFILLHSSNLHSTTSHSFPFISPPLPQDIRTDCKTMKKIFN